MKTQPAKHPRKPRASKTPRTFTEYTYTDGTWEVMAHVYSDSPEIRTIYAYRKDAEECNAGDWDGQNGKPLRPFTWHEGRNPAFVHLKGRAAIRRFVMEFIESGELICTEREDEK